MQRNPTTPPAAEAAASPEDAARERWKAHERMRTRLAEASRRAWDRRGRATAETKTEPVRLYCMDVQALYRISPEPRDAVRRLLRWREVCMASGCEIAAEEAAKDNGPGARPERRKRGAVKLQREIERRMKRDWTPAAQKALRDLARRRRLSLCIDGRIPSLSGRFETQAERRDAVKDARRICWWTRCFFSDAETERAERAAAAGNCTGGKV